MAETLAAHRAHPSVLIWSLGNESGFEKTWAFRKEYDLVKSLDPTRPVIFSYPETVDSRPRPYDIFSMHYQAVDGALGLPDLPKLHDEFAHVGCYNLETLRRDESPRLAWGESLRQGWDNLFDTDGALGCAVWAAVDDVFLLPSGVRKRHQCHGNGPAAGYGPWGCILDRSQREKPEAFLTRKAFSPVRVLAVRPQDDRLELELYNRFDHTDLARVEARVRTPAGALVWRGCVPASIPPHTKGRADRMDGTLVLRDARDGRAIFTSAALYRQGMADRPPETVCLEGGLDLAQTGADLLLRRRYPDARQETLALAFHGSSLRVVWDLEPAGELPAALEKAGLRFCLAGPAVQMDWERRAPYSRYPAGHIGRPAGVARCAPSPGEPDNWAADARDPFLFSAEENEAGQPCRDFRTLRDHILRCRVTLSSGAALELHPADERLSAGVRTEKGAQALLVTVGNFHPTLSWGNFCGRPLCPGDLHMDFTLTLGD